MAIVLQILGLIFVLLIAGLAGFLLYWRYRIRRLADELGCGLHEIMAATPLPPRLTLSRYERDEVELEHEAEFDALGREMADLGFEWIGLYGADELYGLWFEAYVHPAEQLYGVVYDHAEAGVFADLVVRYVDGESLTVSSAPTGEELDAPPGHAKLYLAGEPPAGLYRRLMADIGDRERKPALALRFTDDFEHAWAEEMDWRNLRGFSTDDEIRRTLAKSGERPSATALAELRELYDRSSADGLSEAAQQAWLAATTLTGDEWRRIGDRLVVVHDRLTRDMVAELLLEWAEPDDEDEDEDDPESLFRQRLGDRYDDAAAARCLFEQANQALPEHERFEKLGEVDQPLPADIYLAPG